jgi:hypothetical protein
MIMVTRSLYDTPFLKDPDVLPAKLTVTRRGLLHKTSETMCNIYYSVILMIIYASTSIYTLFPIYAFYLFDRIQPCLIHLYHDECTDFIEKNTCAIKL